MIRNFGLGASTVFEGMNRAKKETIYDHTYTVVEGKLIIIKTMSYEDKVQELGEGLYRFVSTRGVTLKEAFKGMRLRVGG